MGNGRHLFKTTGDDDDTSDGTEKKKGFTSAPCMPVFHLDRENIATIK